MRVDRSECRIDRSLLLNVDSSEGVLEGEVRSPSRLKDGSGADCEVRRGEWLCDVKSLYQITTEGDQPLDL